MFVVKAYFNNKKKGVILGEYCEYFLQNHTLDNAKSILGQKGAGFLWKCLLRALLATHILGKTGSYDVILHYIQHCTAYITQNMATSCSFTTLLLYVTQIILHAA